MYGITITNENGHNNEEMDIKRKKSCGKNKESQFSIAITIICNEQ